MLHIKTDSRKVVKGDTFVAIKGYTVDGHDYIEEAIKKGATKIVCEHGSYEVETIQVPDTKAWLQDYLPSHYAKELQKLTLIGVTGTNGKTTTCFLTYQALKLLGVSVAYIGTIGFWYQDEKRELPNTTPEILDIYAMLLEALNHGVTHVVMEVSSIALDQKRIAGLTFQIGAFTNLTEDHLDYHQTMDAYLEAKKLLLSYLKPNGVMILNQDDEAASEFQEKSYQTIGFQPADYHILSYQDTTFGTKITFQFEENTYEIETNLKSKFNVYNYMMCFAILQVLHFSCYDISFVTHNLFPPKGRCEQIKVKDGIAVIDYAHTPDAVAKIIDAFLENKKNRVLTILGCGGDRDPLKRPIMGKIATEKSDYVIFTSDNPRTEDPKKIIDDILKGIKKENYEVEVDRHKAIHKGLDMIQKNDVLLILGKGHEDYQIIGHEKQHFDDLEEVQKYME